jgi:hypothetical protein
MVIQHLHIYIILLLLKLNSNHSNYLELDQCIFSGRNLLMTFLELQFMLTVGTELSKLDSRNKL